MHATIIGATGATGKDLLALLLADDAVHRVDIFVRRPAGLQHPKLQEYCIDFGQPETWRDRVRGDVLFSCLGTTLKLAGSKEAQFRVDHQYQYEFAKAARNNDIPALVLVSAEHASVKSPFFYARMKGQLEDDIRALQFPRFLIFNPPILERPGSDRTMEVMAAKIVGFLSRFGILKSQKPLPTGLLAKAMLAAFRDTGPGEHSLQGQAIRKYAERLK